MGLPFHVLWEIYIPLCSIFNTVWVFECPFWFLSVFLCTDLVLLQFPITSILSVTLQSWHPISSFPLSLFFFFFQDIKPLFQFCFIFTHLSGETIHNWGSQHDYFTISCGTAALGHLYFSILFFFFFYIFWSLLSKASKNTLE